MVVQSAIRLLEINVDVYFKETGYQNYNEGKITIPARSVMWSDTADHRGNPIYQFASLDYVRPVENGDVYDLVATELLEERIRTRKITRVDEAPVRVAHAAFRKCDPVTGEQYPYEFDISKIEEKLDSAKTKYQYGLILQDSDLYTERDEAKEIRELEKRYGSSKDSDECGLDAYLKLNRKIFKGNQKPPHIHLLVRNEKTDQKGSHQSFRMSTISKLLGIPETQFQRKIDNSVRGGSDGFIDGLRYLTHETDEAQADGKYLYPDKARHVNFDWKAEYEKMIHEKEKYAGHKMSLKDEMRYRAMYEGWTLKQLEAADPVLYMDDFERLRKCRLDYLQTRAPLPDMRVNIYVDGPGGIGKNSGCKVLAEALFPDLHGTDCYFEVGGQQVSFEGYEGQPVIIWNDCRASSLILKFGRGEVFDIFDSHPTNAKHNIKYGSVRLVNVVNIVNGVQSYGEFLDSLAGEYVDRNGNLNKAEDKGQTYRRFPVIISLRDKEYDVLLNRGVVEGSRQYEEFIATKNILGSFGTMAKQLSGEAKKAVAKMILGPIIEAVDRVKHAENDKVSDPDQLPEEFKAYGQRRVNTDIIDYYDSVADDIIRLMDEQIAEHYSTHYPDGEHGSDRSDCLDNESNQERAGDNLKGGPEEVFLALMEKVDIHDFPVADPDDFWYEGKICDNEIQEGDLEME